METYKPQTIVQFRKYHTWIVTKFKKKNHPITITRQNSNTKNYNNNKESRQNTCTGHDRKKWTGDSQSSAYSIHPHQKKSLTKHIIRHVSTDATICVDEWYGYNRLKHIYKGHTVNHGNGIYVTKNQLAGEGTGIGTNSSDKAYINTIEALWGNYCKRPIEITYNHISTRHMQLYFNEFAWRYNSGKTNGGRNGNRQGIHPRFCEFETTIHRCATKTNWENITYQYQPWHGFCRCMKKYNKTAWNNPQAVSLLVYQSDKC